MNKEIKKIVDEYIETLAKNKEYNKLGEIKDSLKTENKVVVLRCITEILIAATIAATSVSIKDESIKNYILGVASILVAFGIKDLTTNPINVITKDIEKSLKF